MEYSSAIKASEVLPFAATRKDLEGIILSELSQRERCCRSHIYVESKKCYKMANITKRKQTHRHREQTSYTSGQGAHRGGGVGGTNSLV